MAFCTECGADTGLAMFCTSCGTPTLAQFDEQSLASNKASSHLVLPTIQGTEQFAFPPSDGDKKKKKWVPVAVALSMLAVFAIAAVALILINPFADQETADESSASVRIKDKAEESDDTDSTDGSAKDGSAKDSTSDEHKDASTSAGNSSARLKDVKIGDTINLGEFAFQANAFAYGTTENRNDFAWQVLDIKDNKALLISKNVIDLRPYHGKCTVITWENSSIRTWLNADFYQSLPLDLREHIVKTEVKNNDNSEHGTRGGNDTKDYIFLLSIDEANKYFSSDRARQANISLVAKSIKGVNEEYGLDIEEYVRDFGGCGWWLRSPGYELEDVAVVGGVGYVGELGNYAVNGDSYGVRPAFWISL